MNTDPMGSESIPDEEKPGSGPFGDIDKIDDGDVPLGVGDVEGEDGLEVSPNGAVKTGDSSRLATAATGFVASAAALGVTLGLKKKNEKEE